MLSGVAKAASRCCELANPAHVRQIASQTGDLLRQMRFVAGRGAIAKRMAALWQRAVGKMLLAKAQWRSCWYGQPAEAAGQGHCGREPSGIHSWQDRRCEVASERAADEEWQTVRRRDGEPSGRHSWQAHRKECKRLNG